MPFFWEEKQIYEMKPFRNVEILATICMLATSIQYMYKVNVMHHFFKTFVRSFGENVGAFNQAGVFFGDNWYDTQREYSRCCFCMLQYGNRASNKSNMGNS